MLEKFKFTFISDTFTALYRPGEYYTERIKDRGLPDAFIKTSVYAVTAGILHSIKSLLIMPSFGFPLKHFLNPGTAVTISFFSTTFTTFLTLFAGALAVSAISAICKGESGYRLSLKVTASMIVLVPVNMFLRFLSLYNPYFDVIIRLVIILYMLWMFYNALVGAHKSIKIRAGVVTLLLTAMITAFSIDSFYRVELPKPEPDPYFKVFEDMMKNSESYE